MRTVYTKTTSDRTIIAEELENGKITVRAFKGTEAKHYVTCSDVAALDLLIEILTDFKKKYVEDHPPEGSEPLRRVEMNM